MLHASRRRGSHQYIYSHDTQAYRHAPAARDASRRWMTSKPGTASRLPSRFMETLQTAVGPQTARRRFVPDRQPRDASHCLLVQPKPSTTPAATEPTGRRGRRRRDMEHGLRDASPCVYPVASRAFSITDASRRSAVQLRRQRGRPGLPQGAREHAGAASFCNTSSCVYWAGSRGPDVEEVTVASRRYAPRPKMTPPAKQAACESASSPSTQVSTQCHGRRERDPASSSSESSQSKQSL